MKLIALRNILVEGQHFDEGCEFETDTDTAAKLLINNRVRIAPEQTKQPPADDAPAPAKKAKR